MGTIINAKELKITEKKMKNLYKNNLILCDDATLTIAIIPDWALDEATSIIGKTIKGSKTEDNEKITTKKDVAYYNHFHYPHLYESICDFTGDSYESGYKRTVKIKEGQVIELNNETVVITEVMKNVGFYHKNQQEEIKFCNTMFETLNFIPVFE